MSKAPRVGRLLAGSVALATFIAYLPALRNGFVYWDDNLYVFENLSIRSIGSGFFRWAFLGFHVSNWHPLAWISHALDYALWGLDPWGHHLTSIVLHVANTAIVVLLAQRLILSAKVRAADGANSLRVDRGVLIAAGVTGLLFGLHPVHVESVAWVAERKDLLCAMFFLLGAAAYTGNVGVGADPEPEPLGKSAFPRWFARRHLTAMVFFLLALMSKPMAVTFPVVLLILDWYPFRRIRSVGTFLAASWSKAPFFALSLASSVLTIEAQRAGGALLPADVVPWTMRFLVAARSLVAYLGKMLWPVHLMPLYPYPKTASFLSFEYAAAVAGVAGITAACVTLANRRKFWLAAWGYYVVTLLPVLGLVQVGGQAMADRYTYLPSLGPFLVAGVCAARIGESALFARQDVRIRKVLGVASLAVPVALAYLTLSQIRIWRNSMDLWNYVIEKAPVKVSLAFSQRGAVLGKMGLTDRAIADLETAIVLNPYNFDAYMNLGVAFQRQGKIDQAREMVEKAIGAKPLAAEAYLYRGSLHEDSGQLDRAVADYTKAIVLEPDLAEAYNVRGVAFGKMGQLHRAIADYSEAIRLNPRLTDAYSNRGVAHVLAGKQEDALEDFNAAVRLGPGDAMTYQNRGAFYRRTGKIDLAFADFRKACELGSERACVALQQMRQERSDR